LAYEFAGQVGVQLRAFDGRRPPVEGVIVDALLGIGLSGEPRADMASAIEQINASGLPVLALDIPSGLNADSGAAPGAAVRAGITLSFIGLKQGLVTGRGPALCGELILADLDVPPSLFERQSPAARLLDLHQCLSWLK